MGFSEFMNIPEIDTKWITYVGIYIFLGTNLYLSTDFFFKSETQIRLKTSTVSYLLPMAVVTLDFHSFSQLTKY